MKLLLVCSSFLLGYSGIHAKVYRTDDLLFVLHLFVSTASITHYITDVQNSIYHKVDKLFAKCLYLVYIYYLLKYFTLYETFMMLNSIITAYLSSNFIYYLIPTKSYWVYFHVNFHVLSTYNHLLVIEKIGTDVIVYQPYEVCIYYLLIVYYTYRLENCITTILMKNKKKG